MRVTRHLGYLSQAQGRRVPRLSLRPSLPDFGSLLTEGGHRFAVVLACCGLSRSTPPDGPLASVVASFEKSVAIKLPYLDFGGGRTGGMREPSVGADVAYVDRFLSSHSHTHFGS